MDLLLWRHAEAAEAQKNQPDYERPLTRQGLNQAHKVAQWLKIHQPEKLHVLTSPAIRTQQTAATFTSTYKVFSCIGFGAKVPDVLSAINWPHQKDAILLVGHQPTLGRLAAFLLSGSEANWPVKKASLWWITHRVQENESQIILQTVISPDFL